MLRTVFSLIVLMLLADGAAVAEAQDVGAFHFQREVDAMTDEDESLIYVREEDPSLFGAGRLIWRCDTADGIELMVDNGALAGQDH